MTAGPRGFSPLAGLLAALAAALFGCQRQPARTGVAEETPAACEQRKHAFASFVTALPERSVSASIRAELPESTLGAVPGNAPVLELTSAGAALDGSPLAAGAGVGEALSAWLARAPNPRGAKPILYVAAARDLDVKTLRAHLAAVPTSVELRLLVGTVGEGGPAPREQGRPAELARRLLSERDPLVRRELAAEGYRQFARCAAFAQAVESVSAHGARERWPALRRALLDAVPRCSCAELDTESLKPLLSAEQRAGASTLGILPLDFLRDARCGASMPLRSIGKLVGQMEHFDREFSGQFREGTVEFDDVLASERLLNYFCDALPGETLAAAQRDRKTLFLRRASERCEGWRFEPLSPGAPMGTLRRVSDQGEPPLAVHYWQGAEELRIYGPVLDAASKPTDRREYPCDENKKLVGVDARSVHLEGNRWFFEASACQEAPTDERLPRMGCFSTLGVEAPPAESNPR